MEINNLKYNYVIIGAGGYYLVGYHDIIDLPYVCYHKDYYAKDSTFFQNLFVRLNFSRRINKFIHTPLSNIVYPKLYPHPFSESQPLCYLFFDNREFVFQTDYLNFLRNRYKDVKLVLFFQDLVSRNKRLNFDFATKQFDLLISYDKGDALKYNMEYHPTPMSFIAIDETSNISESDIYFCGKGKDRYPLINSIYKLCTQMGMICDFHVTDMPLGAERVEGVNYNKPLTYTENLQHIGKTKCILEIMQGGADGYTPRTWESIIYDKHLLTNNKTLAGSPYFDPKGHHCLHSLKDGSVIRWINTKVKYPNELKEHLSPMHLLNFIDAKLQQKT